MFDVVIIGSGPAGLTAAIYAARSGLKTLVFEGFEPGGALTTTTLVENFPGFSAGILGPDLMNEMKLQAINMGAEFYSDQMTGLDLAGSVKTIRGFRNEVEARTVILATGSQHRKLELPNEEDLTGFGVSYCATCDAPFFKDLDVFVVGGGDSAMEETLALAKFARTVKVLVRGDKLRASQAMIDRVTALTNVSFEYHQNVVQINGEAKLESLAIENNTNKAVHEVKADGLFVSIGLIPQVEVLRGRLDLDGNDYVRTLDDEVSTNIEGVFVAGDVSDGKYQQAITAAGSGCKAALTANYYLN